MSGLEQGQCRLQMAPVARRHGDRLEVADHPSQDILGRPTHHQGELRRGGKGLAVHLDRAHDGERSRLVREDDLEPQGSLPSRGEVEAPRQRIRGQRRVIGRSDPEAGGELLPSRRRCGLVREAWPRPREVIHSRPMLAREAPSPAPRPLLPTSRRRS
jgi:hypothetical protein